MTRILFQGDSITDGGRGRSDDLNHIIGHSYPYPIASRLGYLYPERGLEFISRGNSGDTIGNLYARWQEQTLNLRPDILSILIGINDCAQQFESPEDSYVEIYEDTYRMLLKRCLAVNSDMKFILLEPFTLNTGNLPHHKILAELVAQKSAAVKRVAQAFGAILIPLQNRFDQACKRAPADYWIWDSVHPTYNGHGLIADAFLKETESFFEAYPYKK